MKRLILLFVLVTSVLTNAKVNAETFTADDFIGPDKFCTQLFYCSKMISDTPLPAEGAWGRFEKVEGEPNKVRLSSFKKGGAVTFTIEDDKLVLDGSDNKKFTAYTNSNGDARHIAPARLGTYKLIKTRQYFKEEAHKYCGTITREGDHLKVTFDDPDYHLLFHNRSAAQVAQSSYCWKDYMQTYQKIEFKVLNANGSMPDSNDSGEDIPLYIKELNNENGTITYGVTNFGGEGANFKYTDGKNFEIKNDGITVVKTPDSLIIPSQDYTGSIDASYKDEIMGAGDSGGLYTFNVKKSSYHNSTIIGSQTDLSSVAESISRYDITSGWRTDYDGEFEVKGIVSAPLIWKSVGDQHEFDFTDYYNEEIHTFNFISDYTPDVQIQDETFLYNESQALLQGYLVSEVYPELVESYDVFFIAGNHTDITDENFDGTHEHGHTKAFKVTSLSGTSLMRSNDNEPLFFQKLFDVEELYNIGWFNYVDGGYGTLYVRMNLKATATEAQNSVSREAPVNGYGFTALTPVVSQLVTSVDEIGADTTRISTQPGYISVTGASDIFEIYDLTGKIIYTGSRDAKVTVNPGVYLIHTVYSTRKVIVK